jgi:hypothetical protein
MVVSRQSAGSKRFGSRSLSNGKSAVLKENFMSILVIMGATADGVKELVALEGGSRESELS